MSVDSKEAGWPVPDRYHLSLDGITGDSRLCIPNTGAECSKEVFIFECGVSTKLC